mmetsp:Transcript_16140/g.29260  ORF Transcript_16140/g.29260 Transcript_16140/m.29260 type:complete len:223 (+) Transcript_16140:1115-1783(+)
MPASSSNAAILPKGSHLSPFQTSSCQKRHNHYSRPPHCPRRMHRHCRAHREAPCYYCRSACRQRSRQGNRHQRHRNLHRHHRNRLQTPPPRRNCHHPARTPPLRQSLRHQGLHLHHHHHRPNPPSTDENSYQTTFPTHSPDSSPWQSREYSAPPPSPPLPAHRTASAACVPTWHPVRRQRIPPPRVGRSRDGGIRVAGRRGRRWRCGVRRRRACARAWRRGW